MYELFWDWRIILDLFLGGLGVGCFLLASYLYFFHFEKHPELVKVGVILTPFLVILGLFFLLLELGNPFLAIFKGPFMLNASSVTYWGSLLQTVFILLALYVAFKAKKGDVFNIPKKWMIATTIAAILTGLYHGILLLSTARLGWGSATTVIFFISSLIAGFLLVKFVVYHFVEDANNDEDGINLPLVFIILLAIQLVAVFSWKYSLSIGLSDEQSLNSLFNQSFSVYWYLLVWAVGTVIPMVLIGREIYQGRKYLTKATTTYCTILVLIGTLSLKSLILIFGQMKNVIHF
jgi:protein NrfD